MSKATDQLDRLYARLPKIACQRKCQEACGPIMMSGAERARLKRKLGHEPPIVNPLVAITMSLCGMNERLICSLLDKKTGLCTVYPIRPLVCRLFGLVKKMACPFGCIPERWVGDEEARGIMAAAERIKATHLNGAAR